MTTLAGLHSRLDAVRRRERRALLAAGLGRAVAALVAAVLAYALFDGLFEPPLAGRWLGAAALAAAGLWTGYRGVLAEWRRRLDDDEIALRVEERHPELRGRLISTVQLARAAAAGRFPGSPELLGALEEDTLRQVAPLDFMKVVNREGLVKMLILAAVALCLQGACLARFSAHFQALAQRLVDREGQFSTRTRILGIQVQAVPPGGAEPPEAAASLPVARGDALRVLVRVDEQAEVPAEPGTLTCASENATWSVELRGDPQGGGLFSGVLPKALEDLSVTARLGDARSRTLHVRVLARPEVQEGQVQYAWPEYITQPAPPPEKFGALAFLQGGRAEIALRSTKPLVEAQLVLLDGRRLPLVPAGAGALAWRLPQPLLLDRNTSYHVELKDTDGLANSRPAVEYPIEARADAAPVMRLVSPARDGNVTPRAHPVLVFDVHDDYGVRAVWLVYRVQSEGQNEESAKPVRLELPLAWQGLDRRHPPPFRFTWNLESVRVNPGERPLRPGDQVVFWFEADDFCPFNNLPPVRRPPAGAPPPEAAPPQEPYYPRSADLKFTVVSQEEKTLELQDRIAKLLQQLNEMKDTQEVLKRKVRGLLEVLQKELESHR